MKIILPDGTEARLRFRWEDPQHCEAILTTATTRMEAGSVCSLRDTPSKGVGRRVALSRLLRTYFRGQECKKLRREIWQVYFTHCADLRKGCTLPSRAVKQAVA